MSILTLLVVLAHLFTLGRSGPFSKLFCEPRCNPNKNEPLSQCFFNCGFLRYGKYYDGSVCWYFSRIGQAFATTGFCSQGICLKLFTGGYNGSDAQRHCGDIPRDAPWFKNVTQSSQGPAFNRSEATQQTQIRSNETSTRVLPTTGFQATTTAPPVTTTMSLENSTLSYEGLTTTPFDSTLQSAAYVPTEAPGSTEGVTGEETAGGALEAGSFNASTKEYAQYSAATENSLHGLTTTSTEPESAVATTGLTTTAGGAYSKKAATEYPENGLDASAYRPPVLAAPYSTSDSSIREMGTENQVSKFTVPFAETTVLPTEGYIGGKTTQRGRLNSTETTENATEPPNLPTVPSPLIKHYLTSPLNERAPSQETAPTEPNNTDTNEKPWVENAAEVSTTVVPAEQTLSTHLENTLSALIPTTAEGSLSQTPVVTTELPALGTEMRVSSSLSFPTTPPSSEKHIPRGSVEATRENALGILATTTASWYRNETTTTQATPDTVQEIPLSTVSPAGTNAATLIGEAKPSKMETFTTATSTTATMPSFSNESIQSVNTPPPETEFTFGGSNYTGTNEMHTAEKTPITTEPPLEYLATTPNSQMAFSSHTFIANRGTIQNAGLHSKKSITEASLSSNTSEPSIMSGTSKVTLNAGAATETPPPEMYPATESPHLPKQDDGVENMALVRVPKPASSPTATYQAGTLATTTHESSYTSVGETGTENPTVLITTYPGSEWSHFTQQPYPESPTATATTAVTAPSRPSKTAHQNEAVNSTTRHPTSTTASEAVSEEPGVKTTLFSFSGVPEMTVYDIVQPASAPTTIEAPVSSPPTSDDNETTVNMPHEPAITEEVTSGTRAGGAFNERIPYIAQNYTTAQYPEHIAVTIAPILHTSGPKASSKTEQITEIFLTASEPSSSATVPTVVAAEDQVVETQFNTTSTTGYRIVYEATTGTPLFEPGILFTNKKAPGNETLAYTVKQTTEPSTPTEEMGAVIELPPQLLNIARNDSVVTITKTRRLEPNKVTLRVSWPSLVIAMAIIITRI